jgi:DNA-binding transcriptional MerR regulator
MLKLDELASRAGVSPRTVRYYIQRGVLPAPDFRGPDTAYDDRHLQALRAIKRLQDDYWPLDAIAAEIAGKSAAELKKIAEAAARVSERLTKSANNHVPSSHRATKCERIAVAPGIELLVDDDADRALVEQILSVTNKRGNQ